MDVLIVMLPSDYVMPPCRAVHRGMSCTCNATISYKELYKSLLPMFYSILLLDAAARESTGFFHV